MVWEGKFLRVKLCGRWEYAERPNSPAGIAIVAVTAEGRLLLTEQFRIPVGRTTLELPAGLAGDEDYAGEEYVAAAKRELLEETGYEAAHWVELGGGPPSAGFSNEIIVFFRARDLRKVGEGGGAGAEEIRVHEVPVDQVPHWLTGMEQEGRMVDPKIYAGLYFLLSE